MKCINRVELLGNITQDLELKKTNSGKSYINLSIATNKRRVDPKTGDVTEQSEFHRCVAWNVTAENIAKYLHKGSPVLVTGELHTRSYEKDGQTKYITEISVNDLIMLPSGKKDGNGSASSGGRSSGGYGQQSSGYGAQRSSGIKPMYNEQGRPLQQATAPQGEPVPDDDLPF